MDDDEDGGSGLNNTDDNNNNSHLESVPAFPIAQQQVQQYPQVQQYQHPQEQQYQQRPTIAAATESTAFLESDASFVLGTPSNPSTSNNTITGTITGAKKDSPDVDTFLVCTNSAINSTKPLTTLNEIPAATTDPNVDDDAGISSAVQGSQTIFQAPSLSTITGGSLLPLNYPAEHTYSEHEHMMLPSSVIVRDTTSIFSPYTHATTSNKNDVVNVDSKDGDTEQPTSKRRKLSSVKQLELDQLPMFLTSKFKLLCLLLFYMFHRIILMILLDINTNSLIHTLSCLVIYQ